MFLGIWNNLDTGDSGSDLMVQVQSSDGVYCSYEWFCYVDSITKVRTSCYYTRYKRSDETYDTCPSVFKTTKKLDDLYIYAKEGASSSVLDETHKPTHKPSRKPTHKPTSK